MVIPKAVRDRIGVVGRAELELVETNGQVVLSVPPDEVTLHERDGLLVAERGPNVVPLDWEVVRDMIDQQRR